MARVLLPPGMERKASGDYQRKGRMVWGYLLKVTVNVCNDDGGEKKLLVL